MLMNKEKLKMKKQWQTTEKYWYLKGPSKKSIRWSLSGDFHVGPVVKNLPCSSGGVGLIPGQGTKIPHATEQLNQGITTTESCTLL